MAQRYRFMGYHVADWLSLYRILAFPLLLVFILLEERMLFACFLAASFATDAVDGHLARMLHLGSERGARLDSAGDALTLVASIIGLIRFEWNVILQHAVPLSILAGLYVLEMLASFIRFGKASSFHTLLDKIAFVMLAVFFMVLFFAGYQPWLFYATLGAGFLSVTEEIILVCSLRRPVSDIRGIFWLDKHNLRSFN